MEDRKVCEVSRFCGACSSTLGVVPSTYGAHVEPQALRNLEIDKDCKVCVSVVPCPSCARIIAQDGRVKEVRYWLGSGWGLHDFSKPVFAQAQMCLRKHGLEIVQVSTDYLRLRWRGSECSKLRSTSAVLM